MSFSQEIKSLTEISFENDIQKLSQSPKKLFGAVQKMVKINKFSSKKSDQKVDSQNFQLKMSQDQYENILLKNEMNWENKNECEVLLNILMKQDKSIEELKFISKVMQSLKIFQQKKEELKALEPQFFNKYLKLLKFEKFQTIFEYGDIGDHFFVVLQGEVLCLIPDQQKILVQEQEIPVESEQSFQVQKSQTQINQAQNQERQSYASIQRGQSQVDLDSIQKDRRRRMSRFSNTSNLLAFQQNQIQAPVTDQEKIKNIYPNMTKVLDYSAGQSFGELALITSQRRTATMICSQTTYCMIISKQGFERITGQSEKQHIKEKISYFRKYSFFQELSNSILLQFTQQAKISKHSKGTFLYKKGDSCQFIYFIIKGQVEIQTYFQIENDQTEIQNQFKELYIQRGYQQVIQAILGEGSFFGEEEFKNKNKVRVNDIIVGTNDTELYYLDGVSFLNFLKMYKVWDKFWKISKQNEQERKFYLERKMELNQDLSKFQQKKQNNNLDQNKKREYLRQGVLNFQSQVQEKVEVLNNYFQKQNLEQYQEYPQMEEIKVSRKFKIQLQNSTDTQQKPFQVDTRRKKSSQIENKRLSLNLSKTDQNQDKNKINFKILKKSSTVSCSNYNQTTQQQQKELQNQNTFTANQTNQIQNLFSSQQESGSQPTKQQGEKINAKIFSLSKHYMNNISKAFDERENFTSPNQIKFFSTLNNFQQQQQQFQTQGTKSLIVVGLKGKNQNYFEKSTTPSKKQETIQNFLFDSVDENYNNLDTQTNQIKTFSTIPNNQEKIFISKYSNNRITERLQNIFKNTYKSMQTSKTLQESTPYQISQFNSPQNNSFHRQNISQEMQRRKIAKISQQGSRNQQEKFTQQNYFTDQFQQSPTITPLSKQKEQKNQFTFN